MIIITIFKIISYYETTVQKTFFLISSELLFDEFELIS